MYRENAPVGAMGLTAPESHAAGFLADSDRFHSDVSGEELGLRQRAYERKQQNYANIRQQRAQEEEERWKQIEAKRLEEEDYWHKQRELGAKAKKNQSAVPYDIRTLKYGDNLDGERLRYQDELVKHRAMRRADNLMVVESRAKYDIVNGIGRPDVQLAEPPQPSEELAKFMKEREPYEYRRH